MQWGKAPSSWLITLASAELRNDFAKTGFITVSACANSGRIDIGGALLVDAGARGGGIDPNAVASLNGGKATTSVCPAVSANPPRPSCSNRPIDLTANPMCADPNDRAAHHVVGLSTMDR